MRNVVSGFPLIHDALLFISAEIGFSKPDRRFFSAVEEQLGATSEQFLLIGDDRLNDLAGGKSAGWQVHLVDPQAEDRGFGSLRVATDSP